MAEARVIQKRRKLESGLTLIQHEDWSTTDRDPGSECPKCGARLHYIQDDDDAIYCENDGDGCDFQYSFTEAELQANRKAESDYEDEQARLRTAEIIAKRGGRLVFGEVDPSLFELPSATWLRDDNW
jgi:hypothetical protein